MTVIREYAKRPRCGQWMRHARTWCGRPRGHAGICRTPAAMTRNTLVKRAVRRGLPLPPPVPQPDGWRAAA